MADRRPSSEPLQRTTIVEPRKPHRKSPETDLKRTKSKPFSPPLRKLSDPSILRQGNRGTLSLNASCSSDASSDSSHSRASTGKISAPRFRRKQCGGKMDMGTGTGTEMDMVECKVGVNGEGFEFGGNCKRRCSWVTPNADPTYAAFHDEEWGVPVHDDSKLFELLSFSVALAELTWPTILNKRNIFREVFLHFDPKSVSKLNEKKIIMPGSPGSTLLSELKLRNILENARQICKISEEFGSFDKYIWSFINHKPLVNKFRYPRQVPVKTSKADVISKDLVRRGFRGVGPTAVYSFMQAAGLTNDHVVSCFRFQECVAAGEGIDKDDQAKGMDEKPVEMDKLEIAIALDEISICSE